jgi:hypothetical protein
MTNVSDFYNQPRRVVYNYPYDQILPAGSAGVTNGFPYVSFDQECIDVFFDVGVFKSCSLFFLEWE